MAISSINKIFSTDFHLLQNRPPSLLDFQAQYLKYLNNQHGWPALHQAVFQNDLETVNLFLNKGMDPNYTYFSNGKESNLDALLIAMAIGDPEMIGLMFQYSPKINGYHVQAAINLNQIEWIVKNYSLTPNIPIYPVCKNKDPLVLLKAILSHSYELPEINVITGGATHGWWMISKTLTDNNFAITDFLIDNGCICETQDPNHNYHLMHLALTYGAPLCTITKILNAKGGICNDSCQKGNTLYLAVQHNRDDIVKLLIERGVNTSPIYGYWFKIIEDNAQTPDLTMIKLFLEAGFTVNFNSPKNPLLLAIETGNIKLVKLLLEYGADPNLTFNNQFKYHPLKVAYDKGNQDIINLLTSYNSCLH